MSVDGMEQLILFDYASLDDDDRVFLQDKASETRGLLKRASEDIIQIGRNLIAAKDRLPKGQFIPWVKSELGISQPTAWRFMQVAKGRTLKSFNMNEIVVLPPVERKEDKNGLVKLRGPQDVVKQFFTDFPHLQALSNVEIAKRTGTTEGTVRKVRKELFPPKPTPPSETELPELPDEEPVSDTVDELAEELAEELPPESPPPTPNPAPVMTVEPEKGKEPEPPQAETVPSGTKSEQPKEQSNPPKAEPSEEVKLARDIKRQEIEDRNEELREKGAELPQGKYACLVVDPPWQMEKIEREERPNQMGFDYPTMSEDELKGFPLPDMAANDCHLYLWVTQKHLPLGLRLAEHWGFKYQCLMTWVKNVGITPFSWMYSTEHVLFCTKGSLPLLTIGKRLDFSAQVREHSRKPSVFYDIVRDVSPGPRLDVFSREKRDGFDQFGNEVDKYARL